MSDRSNKHFPLNEGYIPDSKGYKPNPNTPSPSKDGQLGYQPSSDSPSSRGGSPVKNPPRTR